MGPGPWGPGPLGLLMATGINHNENLGFGPRSLGPKALRLTHGTGTYPGSGAQCSKILPHELRRSRRQSETMYVAKKTIHVPKQTIHVPTKTIHVPIETICVSFKTIHVAKRTIHARGKKNHPHTWQKKPWRGKKNHTRGKKNAAHFH